MKILAIFGKVQKAKLERGEEKVELRRIIERGGSVASIETKEYHLLIGGMLFIVGLTFLSLQLWGSSMSFPKDWGDPVAGRVDDGTDWLTREGDFIFSRISDYVRQVLAWIKDGLLWLPWPTTVAVVGLIAWRVADPRVAFFCAASLLAIGFSGLWESAMETMALIFTSVGISIAVAVPVGLVAARSDMVDTLIRPILDGMQTMPSFVYLVPAVFFFSPGNVPAVFATVIYAMPPAIRLTNLGIRQVSPETVEAARVFGATSLQILFKVQAPLALPTIMAGINQTIMMALAMAVIASLVGAGGLGEDVLRAIGRLEVGNSLLAGLAIVFLAIIIDRITQGFAKGRAEATQE